MQRKARAQVVVKKVRHFAQGQAVAVGQADDAQRTFDLPARGVDAVDQEDGYVGIAGLEPFEQVVKQGGEVAVAGAGILQFDDQRIDALEVGLLDRRRDFDGLDSFDHGAIQGMLGREDLHEVSPSCKCLKEIFACIRMPRYLIA